jgi:acyl-CoA synthetase (AMP-forming)/AMP-acid ligase II
VDRQPFTSHLLTWRTDLSPICSLREGSAVRNLVDYLPRSHDRALVEPSGVELRYDQLHQEVERIAGGLHAAGVGPGDRVVLLVPMGIELYCSLLALFHLGAAAVLVDPSGPIEANLTRARPSALIGVPRAHLLRLKTPALRGLSTYISTGFTLLPHRRLSRLNGPPPPLASPDELALITFTTGTTGQPKCMGRSHHRLVAQHEALRCHMDLGPDDVDMPTLPVFLLHSLACGSTCVIPDADLRHPGSIEPDRVLAQMRREQVSTSSGSPAFYARLVERLNETGEQVPSLKRIFLGGARVPAPLLRDLHRCFPQAQLSIVYGSTEAEPIAVLDATQHLDTLEESEVQGRGILVGQPVPAAQVRIVADEICVSGPHVNPSYLDDPDATAQTKTQEVLKDGTTRIWHRTGDAGCEDRDGNLWLFGRIGQDVAGVWPFLMEPRAEHPSFVMRAALVAYRERPILAVQLKHPPDDWMNTLKRILHDSESSVSILRVAEIPLDPRHNAKIDRKALTDLVTSILDHRTAGESDFD